MCSRKYNIRLCLEYILEDVLLVNRAKYILPHVLMVTRRANILFGCI